MQRLLFTKYSCDKS